MEFVLLKKLAKLEGTELWMFIGAIVAVAALIAVLAVLNKKHVNAAPTVEKKGNKITTRPVGLTVPSAVVAGSSMFGFIRRIMDKRYIVSSALPAG